MAIMKKVVLITGVSKGLGEALAQEFLLQGFCVVGTSRTSPSIFVDTFIQGDITDASFREHLITTVEQIYGRLDILVNNAGIGLYIGWKEMQLDDLRCALELNLFAPIALTKLAIPLLRQSHGTIINVSSVAGQLPVAYMGGYNVTKYALNAFSETLRTELCEDHIHVLSLIIGRAATGFGDRALGGKATPHTPGASTPQAFARKVYQAYQTQKSTLIFPSWYALPIALRWLFPRWFDALAKKRWSK